MEERGKEIIKGEETEGEESGDEVEKSPSTGSPQWTCPLN